MPNKIEPIDINDEDFLDSICAEKRSPSREVLDINKQRVKIRYAQYVRDKANPTLITTEQNDHALECALKGMYKSKTASAKIIIDKIKSTELSSCPFCGCPSPPHTIDHYLPKEVYPEFSIFSKNLILSCSHCNTNKSTTCTTNNHKTFFNPYFDDECGIPIYILEISQPYNAPTLKIKTSCGLNDQSKQTAETHWDRLKIKNKFFIYTKDYYTTIWNNIYEIYCKSTNIEFTKLSIETMLNSTQNRYGHNYWDTIILRAVHQNEEIIDYFINNNPTQQ